MTNLHTESEQGLNNAYEFYNHGRYSEALQALNEAPTTPEMFKVKAQTLAALGRTDEAIECYESLIKLRPDDTNAQKDMADFLVNEGRYIEAIKVYEQLVRIVPQSPSLLIDQALAYRLAGFPNPALLKYNEALEIDSDNGYGWVAKADLLIEMHLFDEAIKCLEQANSAKTASLTSSGWISRGYSLLAAGAPKEAIHCYGRALEKNPKDTQALKAQANAHQHLGDLKSALDCYDRLIKIQPHDASVWEKKGYTLSIDGRFGEALACYNKALDIEPENVEAWEGKGFVLANEEHYKEALECYQVAIEKAPSNKLSWFNSGICREQLKQFNQALQDFSQAANIDSKYILAWDGKARCLNELGRAEEALSAYKKSFSIDPNSWQTNNNLGWELSHACNRYEEALPYFDKSIELAPDYALPIVNKAEALCKLGLIEVAQSLLEEASDKLRDQEKGLAYLGLAVLFSDYVKDSEKAAKYYNLAEELTPINEGGLLSIAEVLIRLGRHDEARERISTMMKQIKTDRYKIVANFLLFASFALEGDHKNANNHFPDFIDQFTELSDSGNLKTILREWSYQGFIDTIVNSSIDLTTKFLLLCAIDLQKGRLAAPSLARLNKLLPLVQLPKPLPQQSSTKEEPGILPTLIDMLGKLFTNK